MLKEEEAKFVKKIFSRFSRNSQDVESDDNTLADHHTPVDVETMQQVDDRKNIKYEMFTIERSEDAKVNSAVIILIVGLTSLFSIFIDGGSALLVVPVINIAPSDILASAPPDSLLGIVYLLPIMMFSIAVVIQNSYYLPIIGWFVGGFLASVFVGKEGSRGPLYSIRLIYRSYAPIFSIIFVMTVINSSSLNEIFSIFKPLESITQQLIGIILLYFPLILFILALPLTVVAILGFQLGELVTR